MASSAAITDLAVNQKPVDILTVKEQLSKRGELEEVGGPFYITQLSSNIPIRTTIDYRPIIKRVLYPYFICVGVNCTCCGGCHFIIKDIVL